MRRLACLISLLALTSSVSAQGMEAAARKEKERREKNRQDGVKARVVSDQDVHSGGSAEEPASTPSSKGTANQAAPSADVLGLDAPASGGSTATSDAKTKAEAWRSRYRPAKERIAALEREISTLTDQASRIGAIIHFVGSGVPPTDPNTRTEAEAVVQRLRQARADLASAKQYLQAIEEAARKDGVPSGQLY